MIGRIRGEGQFEVDDAATDELNVLHAKLEAAVNAGDEKAFGSVVEGLVSRIRALGTPLPADALDPSALTLPYAAPRNDDVPAMLDDAGLIPGSPRPGPL